MNIKKVLGIGCLTLFLLFVISVAIGTVYLFKVELASQPAIEFKQPLQDQIIGMGDTLVRFIARDTAGIEHVELWVDGILVASKKSSLVEGSNPFPFIEMWYPQSSGTHTLTARAYNSESREAVASIIVQVNEMPEEQPENLAETEDTGTSAAEPENEGAPNEAAEFTDLIDESIEMAPLEGYVNESSTPLFDLLTPAKLRGTFNFGTILQVEALTLETDRTYDGVFCYLSLADMPVERIPEDGFIDSQEGNFWDIQALLGSDNRRTIIMGESQLFNVMLNCWGAIFEAGAVYELGTVHMVHPVDDWNGDVIDQHADGPSGWFNVSYRIYPLGGGGWGGGDELPPPALTYYCYQSPFVDYCDLNWEYSDENRARIDGFLVVRNDTLLTELPNPRKDFFTLNDFWGTLPTCSHTDVYQVVAYKGDIVFGEKSPRSNAVTITGDPCYHWVQVHFDYINPTCLSGDSNLDICSPGEASGDTELSVYGDGVWEGYEGCSYSNLWANDEHIDVGSSDMWDCYGWTSGGLYKVSEQDGVETDTALVFLESQDTLSIGMSVMDYDIGYDDRQCYGEYVYYPSDLEEIAKLPNRSQTFTRQFSERGGGYCNMQYTVEIMPSDYLTVEGQPPGE